MTPAPISAAALRAAKSINSTWDLLNDQWPDKRELKIARLIHAEFYAARVADLEAKLAAAQEDGKRLEWHTGTPPVAEGDEDAYWCQYEYNHNGETKIGYGLLEYRNRFVAAVANFAEPGPEEIEANDYGDCYWTGWFERSCDQCDTFWRCTNKVIAWMKLPRKDAARQTLEGK